MLSCGMLKCLQKLVEAALLETFDVVCRLFVIWKFILVKVQLVSGAEDYKLILVIELCLSYLFGKWLITCAYRSSFLRA